MYRGYCGGLDGGDGDDRCFDYIMHYEVMIRLKVFGMNLYMTKCRMRRRQERDNGSKEFRKMKYKYFKLPLIRERGGKCELCGCDDITKLQIHHILPYCYYPNLEYSKINMMIVCEDCHRMIHKNPLLNAALIRKFSEINHVSLERLKFKL
jgi:5-methylcytosine-specific restriction endonuclease McrA